MAELCGTPIGRRGSVDAICPLLRPCPEHPQLSLEPTEHEGPRSGGAAATASPEPLTAPEFDAIVALIWDDLDEDRHRIGDLLADAIAFIGGIALRPDTDPHDADRAAAVLRAMEQRALWGPNHEQEDHR